jgi:hypothetical protein
VGESGSIHQLCIVEVAKRIDLNTKSASVFARIVKIQLRTKDSEILYLRSLLRVATVRFSA